MRNIFAKKVFFKCIVSSWNRSMCRKQGRGSYCFKRLIKGKMLIIYQTPQSFKTDKCRMPFIAVIDIGFQTHSYQGSDASDTKY